MTKIYVSTPNKIHSSDKYFDRKCIKDKNFIKLFALFDEIERT